MIRLIFTLFLTISCVTLGQPITSVYCHGLGCSGLEAVYRVKDHEIADIPATQVAGDSARNHISYAEGTFAILNQPLHQFDFPSSQTRFIEGKTGQSSYETTLNRNKVSLGQHIEMSALGIEVQSLKGDLILSGRSMGAATIINYVGICQPARIKALVLEAPFDTIENLLTYKFGVLNIVGLGALGRSWVYPAYQSGLNLFKPINAIKLINKDIPVILIHSQKDTLISVRCSRNLYCALAQAGHTKVHLYELVHASHNNAPFSEDADGYQRVVHAFYKAYDLPHDPELAEEGRVLFDATMPSIDAVQRRK